MCQQYRKNHFQSGRSIFYSRLSYVCQVTTSTIEIGPDDNIFKYRGDVIFDPSVTSAKSIAEAIDDMGFEATVITAGGDSKDESIKLTITGMTCASCVRKIETHLKRKAGIKSATVALTTSSATISFDRSLITVRNIIEEIVNIGFEAEIRNDTDNFAILEQKDQIRKWKR